VILRLNEDGTTPTDKPLRATGAATGGKAGANIGRIFAYGLRKRITAGDARLQDGVMDNVAGHERTEGETILFGINFGTVTDVQTRPNGNLFVVWRTVASGGDKGGLNNLNS
jgi:glucose/arabinose dehydrogenase